MLHSGSTINIQQIWVEMDFNIRRMTLAARNHAQLILYAHTTGNDRAYIMDQLAAK